MMARDTKTYVYYTIGILRDGVIHREIQADAKELDAQEPTVAKFRLAQFYELRRMGYLPSKDEEEISGHSEEHRPPIADLKANASEAADAWPE